MKQLSPGHTPTALRVFFACLLSFNIFITPIGAMAATSQRSEVRSQRSERKDKDKAAADDIFAKPLDAKSGSSLPGPRPEAAPQPLAPPPAVSDVSANLTATLVPGAGGDVDSDGKADPGDTINYSLTLTSSGAGATGLSLSNPLDSHTTLVGGSLNSTPVAFDQSVNTNEDTGLSVTIQGQDPDGSNLTFNNIVGPSHGSLGVFSAPSCTGAGICSSSATYTPNADYNGSDSFTFKVNDGTANSNENGTVSITVNPVNDAPTFTVPGNPSATNEDAGAISVSNYITGVRPGNASDTLENGQTVSFVISNNTNPSLFSSAPALNVTGASYPKTATLTYTAAANQNGTATITYHAHDNGGTSPGVDNSGDQTFTITVNAVNDPPVVVAPSAYSAQANMKITGLTGLLGNVNDNADNGVNGCVSTTFTVTSGSISGSTAHGGTVSNVNLNTGTFDYDPPAGYTGADTFTYTVSDTGCPGVAVSTPATTVTINVAGPVIWFVNTTLGVAGTGRLSAPFNTLAAATAAMGINANQRIFVASGSTTAVGTTVTLAGNNSQANLALAQAQAQWLIGQGTVASSFDSFFGITPPAGTIARPTLSSNATTANGLRPTIQGTVTMKENTVVEGLNINTSAGGTKGLTASGLAAGTSGSLLTIKDVSVTTAGGNAVDISAASNTNNSVEYTTSDQTNSPNVIVSGTGSALIVNTVSIGTNGLTFKSITAAGSANGIFLSNTGNGFLNVYGDGSNTTQGGNNTGGTISNTTGADGATSGIGVYLNNVKNITLRRMHLQGNSNFAVFGNNVTALKFEYNTVDGTNGSNVGAFEDAIQINGLFGTGATDNSFTNDVIKGGWRDNLHILNITATNASITTPDKVTITGCLIRDTNTGSNGNDNLHVRADGTGNIKADITNNTFAATNADHIQTITDETAKLQVVITGNTLSGGGGGSALGEGITISGGNASPSDSTETVRFNVSNNTMSGTIQGGAININEGSGNGNWQGQVANNTIGDIAITCSGATQSSGIRLENHSKGTLTGILDTNHINQTCGAGGGISLSAGDNTASGLGNGPLNATVTGNIVDVANPTPGSYDHGIVLTGGGGVTGNTNQVCLDLKNNTSEGSHVVGSSGFAYRIRQRFSQTVFLPGYGGANNDNTAVANYFIARPNTAIAGDGGTYSITNTVGVAPPNGPGGGFVNTPGGAQCTQPTVPVVGMLFNEKVDGQQFAWAGKVLQNSGTDSLFATVNPQSDFAWFAASRVTSAQATPAIAQPILLATVSAEAFVEPAPQTRNVVTSAANSLKHIASAVSSLIEPTAYAEGRSGVRSQESGVTEQSSEVRDQKTDVRLNHVAKAEIRGLTTGVSSQESGVRRSNHATSAGIRGQRSEARNRTTTASAAFVPTPIGSFPINGTGTGAGFTLPAGKTTTITFKATLNNPPNLSGVPPGTPQVSAQGTLTGSFIGNPIVTNDPNTVAANDATVTPVDLFDTTTTLGAVPSAGSWNVGQTVTFTATVAPNPANATVVTGVVVFKDSGTPIAACNGASGVAVSAGSAQCVVTFSSGAHSVQAFYSGDGNYDPSTSNTLSQGAVNQSGTTTTVTSSLNPSLVTQSVTFTATVASSTGFTGPPTGTVQFKDNLVNLGAAQTLNGSGVATLTTSALIAGNHPITAVYSGDGNFTTSTGTLSAAGGQNGDPQVVNKSNTTTALLSSANPVAPTVEVTYTATVSSSTSVTGPPTGTVTFNDGVNPITCTNAGGQTLSGGVATCKFTYPDTTGSPHDISAVYNGDPTFNTSTSNHISETVLACSSSVVVLNTNDSGAGSLRDAISTGVCDGGTITFDTAGAFSTPQTITLSTGQLSVGKSMTIDGPDPAGNHVTIDAAGASRVFAIQPAKTVGILDLTIANGKATGAFPASEGGGIFNDHGVLTLTNCVLSGNVADGSGGGIFNNAITSGASSTVVNGCTFINNTATNGGALYNYGDTGTATMNISNSTLATNSASASGGAIDNFAAAATGNATLTIVNSTISGNNSNGDGGGLYNVANTGGAATATLTSVTITGNHADNDDNASGAGGGINVASGTVTLKNTIVAGNLSGSSLQQVETATVAGTITGDGNAKVVVTAAGMSNSPRTVSVPVLNTDTADVVAGKMRAALTADTNVNGFFTVSGATDKIILTARTVAANDATLNIATDNDTSTGLTASPTSADTTPGRTAHDIAGTINTTGSASTFNLIGDAASSGTLTNGTDNNIVGASGVGVRHITTILNSSLANNGGPTKTHALVDNSPAIDRGNSFTLTTDQRGLPRPVDYDSTPTGPGDDSDIGSFERASPAVTITKGFNPTGITSGGTSTITLTLSNPNASPVTDGAFTDTLTNMSAVAGNVTGTCTGTTPGSFVGGETALSFSNVNIPANSSCTIKFDVTSTNPGANPNTTSGVTATGLPNGSASNTATLTVFSGTSIQKSFSPTAIQTGGTSTITLTLTNTNAGALTNASFTDNLVNISAVGGPAGGTCVGASSNTVTAGSGTKSFSGITIPGSGAGGTCTVTFGVTSTNAGDNPNQTSGVTTDQTALGAPSNSATLTVLTAPSISKQFTPANIQTGGTSTVTLTLTNPNALALNNASFTDTLVNMSAVGGNVTGTCSGTTPSTLGAGATALSFTGVTIPGTGSGGSCTVTFDVTSSTLGTNPNTTSGVTTQQTNIAGSGSNTANLSVFAPPVVLSITRASVNPTSASAVDFTVTFSKAVTGVDLTDFTLSTAGLSGASVTNVSAGPSATYTVTVNTGSGDGTLGLNVIDDDSIQSTDALVLPLGGTGAGNGNFTTGEVYTVDRSNPSVTSITRAGSNPTNATSVAFTVTFSESVTGVDNTDFSLTTSGVAGASVSGVTGSGSTRTVTVNTGSGNGTIKLNLIDDDTVVDVVNKPLGGPGAGNGNFTTGETYNIDKTAPIATINQAVGQTDPVTGPTATTVINFKVTLSKSLTTASAIASFTNSDISLSGTAGATVANITGSGDTYNVAVEGMTQSGTVIININAGVFQDDAGNLNAASTIVDNTVTFNVDNFTTFEVNSTADTDDGQCAPIGTGNGCTLREAIIAANTDAGAETITFNSTVFASPGPYTINLTGALPNLASDITINGPGAKVLTVKRNTGGNYTVFTIASGNVTLDGLTISNGNAGAGSGGGIFNNSTGIVTVSNSAISGNTAGADGGGILNSLAGTLNVINSTISGNSAAHGGALSILSTATVNITNSTISGNLATLDGGGVYNTNGTTVITASTITNNRADNDTNGSGTGGGVFRGSGTVTLRNTIVAGNFNDASPSTTADDISGTVDAASSFNLIGNGGAGGLVNGTNSNQVGVSNAGLNPLGDNGGPTMTHSLLCTSPAIDKGFKFTTTTDQRGGTRPVDFADAIFPNAAGGDGSDIGAFETQAGGGCVPEAQPPNPQPTTNEDNSVNVQLKAVYSQNVQMTFSIDTAPTNGSLGPITGTTCSFNLSTTCTATVLYTPHADYFGPDTFKFTATTNPGGLTSDPAEVDVTINSVNDPPSFFLGPTQNILEDAGPQSVSNFANTISVGPANETGQTYSFILQTDTNPGLFSAAPALDTAGTLTYTPAANANGSATITFVMKDSGGTANGGNDTSAPRTFTINVASVNDAPSFTKGPDISVNENAPAQTIANWATAISPGPANESAQTVTFKVTNLTNPGLFSIGPLLGSNGTLNFTPTPNTSGSCDVTIELKDSGGTANGGVDTSASQTFTITVKDGGALQFSSATYSVGESGGNAVITITRTGGTAGTTSVQFATSNGTATTVSDYTAVSQTVTFNDGDTSKTVNIPITNDLLNEPNETVNLALSGVTGSGVLGAPSTAVLTINDDDPVGGYIKFSSANYSVAEGGVATITVQRTGTLTQAVTVDYATSDSSVGPESSCAPTPGNTLASSRCDFSSAFGTITFGAGDGADKTFTVLIDQDSYVEGPETLSLTLSNPTGGANLVIPSTSTLTINDDVSEPGFNLADDTSTFVEQLYRDFLNRASDPAGKAFWVDNIDRCNDPARRFPGLTQAQCIEVQRINTAAAFFLSIEFQTTGGTAYLTNKAAFGTVPTFLNFETDAQAIGRGYVFGQPGAETILEANKVAYFNSFVARSSFTAIYGGLTNAQYVDTLIMNTGVSFTPGERNALVNGLNNATETRATVLRKITEKPSFRDAEFNRMFVLMEYFGFLRRDPDAAGFNFWLTKLNQFNGNYIAAEMIKAFISSAEYRHRFGP